MLLHIVLADDNIQRVRTEGLPETVDELKMMLKTCLNLEGEMVIQFQDEEFGGQFCNLNNMEDLPSERIKLKVIMKAPPSSPQSDYTLDTASLDTSSQSSGETSGRSKPWPNPFPIPTFSYDIEMKLRRGNEAYQKDGSLLPLSSHTDVKIDILDKVGRAMYDFNAYPTQRQIEEVAKTLVEKHPCLKEPGSKEGFYSWKFSLGFKMGNLRQKYRIAGCPELTVNRKRSAGQETRKMKKARRSETNFLPDFPQGRTPNSLEEERESLLDEVKKKKPDCNLIDSLMGWTFALRRQEIVEKEPLVTEIESRWPALFSERQIGAEFTRLVSADLLKSFLSGLDQHLPRLIDIYKARKQRKTNLGHDAELQSVLESLDSEKSNQNKRSTALLGLPFILKEDPSNFIKFSETTDAVEVPAVIKGVNVGLLITTEQNAEMTAQSKNIVDVAVILEERIVLHPYEDHSGSLRLITIKPMTAQPTYSYPSSSSHSQDSVVLNGEANHGGLKQKSDIEHYRNKLRQKARRKGYGEFSLSESGSHGYSHRDARHSRHDNGVKEPMTAEEKRASFAGCHKRYSHPREPTYWSRQSLSSPSPVETEMDLLVLRERSRRGIRNNGYDGEPEPFEETNVDRLMSSLGYGGGSTGTGNGSLGVKAHRGSDSSTLSSQPSIDEVRTQMHMLLGNAFSLAPPDHDPPSPPTNGHHHHHHHAHRAYNPSHTSHYSDGVTSAPGTMNHPCGGRQRSIGYEDMHQCSLPKPGFRFTQLPDMGIGSPPPLIPSRPGPPPGTSLRRSTPDVSLKPRVSEASDLQAQQHNGGPYLPLSRTPFPAVTVDQSITTYSGNPITAVYAISANRPGYSDYFVMSPPSSYRSPSWMSYPPEPEDLPRQWNDTPNSRHLETIC